MVKVKAKTPPPPHNMALYRPRLEYTLSHIIGILQNCHLAYR